MAIDAKGVVGDPALEIGRYVGNQLARWAGTAAEEHAIVDQRLEAFSRALAEPVEQLRAAAVVDTIISLGWQLESDAYDGREFGATLQRALHLVG